MTMKEINVPSSRLNHVGIAVKDLDAAIEQYRVLFADVRVGERIVVEEQGVEVCFLEFPDDSGGARIELLGALSDDSPVGRFLAKRGEGQHHICFSCDNLDEKLNSLKSAGVRLIDETPRIGATDKRIAFVHPGGFSGVLIEFEEE